MQWLAFKTWLFLLLKVNIIQNVCQFLAILYTAASFLTQLRKKDNKDIIQYSLSVSKQFLSFRFILDYRA
jgi:hypothetical protein